MGLVKHIQNWQFTPRFGSGAVTLDIKTYEQKWAIIDHSTLVTYSDANRDFVHQHADEIRRALQAQKISDPEAQVYFWQGETLERLHYEDLIKGLAPYLHNEDVEYFQRRTEELPDRGSPVVDSQLIGKRVNVLDKGWIELVDLMPHPLSGVSGDLAIVNAARVSFLGESKGLEKDKRLLFYLMQHQHTTPFEMVEFKFRVRAPLVTFWQWVRHRTWNMNAQSGRYTEFEENDFYIPSVWRKQSKDNKQASEGELSAEDGAILTEALLDHYAQGYKLYEQALRMGVSKEMARFFLPAFSVYYTWVMKVDAHNLMNFLRLRMAQDAQYEIRVYANAIYEHFFKPALPWTAEAFELYRKL